jgi:uncharacterized protein YjbJ (UPF0337 family)
MVNHVLTGRFLTCCHYESLFPLRQGAAADREAAMRKITFVAMLGAALSFGAPALAQTTQANPAAMKSATTWDMVAGNWKRLKGSVKRQWGKLTHNDIAEANGRREVLVGKIQARYGIDKDKADRQVDAWMKSQR